MSKTNKAVSSGQLTIAGHTFEVHVLENGKRVIEADDFNRLTNLLLGSETKPNEDDLAKLVKLLRGKKKLYGELHYK